MACPLADEKESKSPPTKRANLEFVPLSVVYMKYTWKVKPQHQNMLGNLLMNDMELVPGSGKRDAGSPESLKPYLPASSFKQDEEYEEEEDKD